MGGPGFHQGVLGSISYPQLTIVRNNTFYGDNLDPNNRPFAYGEMVLDQIGTILATGNIAVSTLYTKCGGGILGVFAQALSGALHATVFDLNWLWNTANSAYISSSFNTGYSCASGPGIASPGQGSTTLLYCPGNTVADPQMVGPTAAPNTQWFCSGFSDTQACAATVIGHFTPTASGSTAFGFRALAPTDQWNSTPFFKNVLHALPAALNPHGF